MTNFLQDGLNVIHKSSFSGSQKLWILQHLLIPKVQWVLLIYEVSISSVSTLENKVSVFMRKWLNVHPSITKICLYSPVSPCPLPLKSLSNVLRSSKISGHLLLRDSNDPKVSSANPNISAGFWRADQSTSITESEMKFIRMKGATNPGKYGLGIIKTPQIPPKGSHCYRKLVSATSQKIEEERDIDKALKLQLQCHWMSWQDYIKTNLSWKNILALPPNLLSFCISSTYNVLPFPSNLHRWHQENDPFCTSCGKHICTIAHILGACKFSLDQGRFTFRHDNVLNCLVSFIRTFIKNIKPSTPKKSNAIHFIKAGDNPPKYRQNPTGILHLASDWVVISDLNENYVFPIQIALTELRPDVVIFSKSLRRVILVELTCPCEENMPSWHSTKISKYSGLLEIIKKNRWYVDLFAVEVGARGYPSTNLKYCLQKLGFCNNLLKNIIQSLSRISMECSFYIWMHRNSKDWTSQELRQFPSTATEPLPQKQKASKNVYRSQPNSSKECLPISKHAGFINKGNTCYINSILQALSVVTPFWNQHSSQSGTISPLIRALTLNLSLLKKRSSPVDPSNFLRAFQQKIVEKLGTPFNINSQQDVPEIFQILLDELKGSSPIVDGIISSSVVRTTTCNNCFISSAQEDKHNIISLPLSNSISSSLTDFLKPEELRGNNRWFCNVCNSLQDSVRDCNFTNCGTIFIVALIGI